jgi:hypothetical protein
MLPDPESLPVQDERSSRRLVRLARLGLAIAVVSMSALHVLQPELSPIVTPVSFYVLGQHGWLLTLALGAFGLSAVALGIHLARRTADVASRCLIGFGSGMLVDAAIRSDAQFPWEAPPTLSGLIHAAAAIVAPPLLIVPMTKLYPSTPAGARTYLSIAVVVLYSVSLLGSGASLTYGFVCDVAPPLIGLAERTLALAAVVWLAMWLYVARQRSAETTRGHRFP